MNITKLRNEIGITQEELASELGIHLRTITNWEGGKVRITEAKKAKLLEFFQNRKQKSANLDTEEPRMPREEMDSILMGMTGMSIEDQNIALKKEVMRLRGLIEKFAEDNR